MSGAGHPDGEIGGGVVGSSPVSPPMEPFVRPERPTWAGTIGWISVVLGGLGILSNTCGAFAPLLSKAMQGFMQSMMKNAPQADVSQFEAQMAVQQKYAPWMVSLGVLSLLASIGLLSAGIKLLKQRTETVAWHRAWAVCRLALVVVGMMVAFKVQSESMAAASAASGAGAQAAAARFGAIAGLVGVILSGLWGAIWPVFVLIWFARPRVNEQIRLWTPSA